MCNICTKIGARNLGKLFRRELRQCYERWDNAGMVSRFLADIVGELAHRLRYAARHAASRADHDRQPSECGTGDYLDQQPSASPAMVAYSQPGSLYFPCQLPIRAFCLETKSIITMNPFYVDRL